METTPRRSAEDRFEGTMGLLLRTGVFVAAAFVLVGGIIYLFQFGGARPHYQDFRGTPNDFRTVAGIARLLLSFRGEGIILAGVIILIATPVFRVIYALIGFLKLRDRLYVLVSLIVLAVLLFSIFGPPS